MIPDTVSESIRTALDQLHSERARIDAAIEKLEVLIGNGGDGVGSGRGGIARYSGQGPHKKRSTAGWTAEKRAAAAERMQRYWAARRLGSEAEGRTNASASRKKRSTAGWTDEKRAAAAERMRQYWATRSEDDDAHDSELPPSQAHMPQRSEASVYTGI